MHQSELLERFVDVCIQVKFEAPTSLLVRVCGHVPYLQFFGAIELLREMGDGLLVTLRLKLIVLVSNIVQILNDSRQVYCMLRFFELEELCVGRKDVRKQQQRRIGICQYMVMAQIEQQLILTLQTE